MLGAAKEEMTVTTRAENFDMAYIYAISAVAAHDLRMATPLPTRQ